jgi:hypothetical protein
MEEVVSTFLNGMIKTYFDTYKEQMANSNFFSFICSNYPIQAIRMITSHGMKPKTKDLKNLLKRKDINSTEVVDYILKLNSTFSSDKILASSIKSGNWETFSLLLDKLHPGKKTFFNLAYYGGKDKVDEYKVYSILSDWSVSIWKGAIKRKDRELYAYLFQNDYPLLSKVLTLALKEGELELVYNLREKHCPWSSEFINVAASKNNIIIMDWADKQGCPMTTDCLYYAKTNNAEEAMIWLSKKII